MMSLKPSVPERLCLMRLSSPSSVAQADLQPLGADWLDHEIDRARAHRRDDVVDAAVRGLDDDRRGDGVAAQPRENAEAVEVRHHQIEDHAVDAGAVRSGEQCRSRVAAFCGDHLVAEFLHHAFEEPALHGIVIDDEDGHRFLGGLDGGTLCRFGAISPRGLNEPLISGNAKSPDFTEVFVGLPWLPANCRLIEVCLACC